MRSLILRFVLVIVVVSLGVILMVAATSQAYTTYDLTATPSGIHEEPGWYDWYGSGFSLRYLDSDDDGLFSLNELVPNSFSGATEFGITFTEIFAVPDHPPTSPFTDGESGLPFWCFRTPDPSIPADANDTCAFASEWSYNREVVPLPPSALLLGAGLLGLAGWARRKKRGGN